MTIWFAAIGVLTLVIWVYLAFANGTYWWIRPFLNDDTAFSKLNHWPSVAVVIPARNEAQTIERVLESLLAQNYPGSFRIVLVDDHSDDTTGLLARKFISRGSSSRQLDVLSGEPLPAGWTGKLWALQQGVEHARTYAPDLLWFTDADIVHGAGTLEQLVLRAEANHLDLTSLMVLLQTNTFAERLLIPAFVYFFLMLYPPLRIAAANASTAGAAGGCILIRSQALERAGGIAAIRSEVIDDCALARAVKRSGGRLWLGLTRRSVSLRNYAQAGEIRDMIARTAFTQLSYSTLLLAGTLIGMFLTFVAPVLLLFTAQRLPSLFGLLAWILMAVTFLPIARLYRIPVAFGLLLPFIAVFYSYATWLSAGRYWLGRGGQWKGRTQAPKSA